MRDVIYRTRERQRDGKSKFPGKHEGNTGVPLTAARDMFRISHPQDCRRDVVRVTQSHENPRQAAGRPATDPVAGSSWKNDPNDRWLLLYRRMQGVDFVLMRLGRETQGPSCKRGLEITADIQGAEPLARRTRFRC